MKTIKFITYTLILVLFVCIMIVILIQPNRFQKWNSLKPTKNFNTERFLDDKDVLNLPDFIEAIPYRSQPHYVYAVHPENRFNTTIAGGNGDCSNFSFAGAYHFIREGIDFELIHFLPPNSLFSGGGHVAVRVPYQLNNDTVVGILDIAGGGVPLLDGIGADYGDAQKTEPNLEFIRVSDKAPIYFKNYYTNEFLNSVYLGFTPASGVKRYFRFIENFYVPLGNDKLEKMVYDGLALFSGQYYDIYTDEELLSQFRVERYFFIGMLILLRLLVTFMFLIVIYESFRLILVSKFEKRTYE